MYENYTKQSLPSKSYRELLGSALCVFSSNNAFVIENILHTDSVKYNWYELTDKMSGELKNTFESIDKTIAQKFNSIVEKRNRIIHSFQITDEDDEQRLATKTKIKEGNKQFVITEQYLLDFIKENQELSDMLYAYRDKVWKK